jgi:hypothetical protein
MRLPCRSDWRVTAATSTAPLAFASAFRLQHVLNRLQHVLNRFQHVRPLQQSAFGFSTPRCSAVAACYFVSIRLWPVAVASGSYSVTDPIRCRSTASGYTAGRSTAVGQRHFPFGAHSGLARSSSYHRQCQTKAPPSLSFCPFAPRASLIPGFVLFC